MTAWHTRDDMAKRCNVSVGAIRKAQGDHRIVKTMKGEKGIVLIADDDPQIIEWAGDDATDPAILKREIKNLSKRVKQAERKAERAEREKVKTLERFAAMSEKLTTVNAIVASAAIKALDKGGEDIQAEVVNE